MMLSATGLTATEVSATDFGAHLEFLAHGEVRNVMHVSRRRCVECVALRPRRAGAIACSLIKLCLYV